MTYSLFCSGQIISFFDFLSSIPPPHKTESQPVFESADIVIDVEIDEMIFDVEIQAEPARRHEIHAAAGVRAGLELGFDDGFVFIQIFANFDIVQPIRPGAISDVRLQTAPAAHRK